MTINKKKGRETSPILLYKILGIIILLCQYPSISYGNPSDFPMATICYHHMVHQPFSRTIFNIYEGKTVVTLIADKYEKVNTIVQIDSIYGVCEVSGSMNDTITTLVKRIYLQGQVTDYLLNEPSEWCEVSDSRNEMEIEFNNGKVYFYLLGNLNKSGTQYIGSHIIQYTYSFRKLVKLVEQLHDQMLTIHFFQ